MTDAAIVGEPMTDADITVVIADDHAVVRKGLRLLLDAEPGFEVVAEAGDVPDAVRITRAHRPRRARARPQHAGRARASRRSRDPRGVARTPRRRADDAGRPGVRAPGAAAGAPGLRAQGGRRRRAASRRSALAADGETYLNPRLGAQLAAAAAAAAGPARRPHRARGRGAAADRARPHQRRDRRAAVPVGAHGRDPPRAHPAEAAPLARAPSSCATRSSTTSCSSSAGATGQRGGHDRAVRRGCDLELAARAGRRARACPPGRSRRGCAGSKPRPSSATSSAQRPVAPR